MIVQYYVYRHNDFPSPHIILLFKIKIDPLKPFQKFCIDLSKLCISYFAITLHTSILTLGIKFGCNFFTLAAILRKNTSISFVFSFRTFSISWSMTWDLCSGVFGSSTYLTSFGPFITIGLGRIFIGGMSLGKGTAFLLPPFLLIFLGGELLMKEESFVSNFGKILMKGLMLVVS